MAGSRKLEVQIVGDASSLSRAFRSSSAAAEGFGTKLGRVLKVGALAAAGGVVALGYELKKAVGVAMEAETSQAKLATAFKNAGIGTKQYAKQIEAAEAASRKLGFADADTRSSLGSLIGAAGSTKAAIQDMAVAQDFARFKQIDLGTATKTLVSVMAGNARALKQVGINIPAVTLATDALKRGNMDLTTIQGRAALAAAKLADAHATAAIRVKALQDRIEGQAQAFAGTGAGSVAIFRAEFERLQASIGEKVMPLLVRLLAFINDNWSTIETVANAVGAALVASFDAIGAAITYLQGLWERHRVQVLAAISAIQAAVMQFVAWFRTNLVPPIQEAIAIAEGIWRRFGDSIKQALALIIQIIKADVILMLAPFRIFLDILRGDWSKAWNDLKSTVSTALSAIVSVIRGAVGLWLTAAKALGAAVVDGTISVLKTIGGKVWDELSKIGGIITGVAGYVYGLAKTIGTQIIAGVIAGLAGLFSSVKDHISGAISSAVHGAGSILKGSGEFMFTKQAIGYQLVAGIIEGLSEKDKDVKAKLKSILGDPATIAALNAAANLVGKNAVTEMIRGLVGMTPSLQAQARQQARDMMEAWKQSALQKVADAKSALSSAMGDMASAALAAFDAVSAKQTDAQKKLAKMQAEDAKKAVDDQVKAAQDALQAAKDAADAIPVSYGQPDSEETAAARKKAQDDIAAARVQLTAALRAQKEAELAVTIQSEQDKRAVKRQALVDDLADLETFAREYPKKHKELLERVKKLWQAYIGPARNWGKNIGDALAQGLRDAIENVRQAAQELADAMKNNLKRGSPTKEGPLSTFDMKDAGYDMGAAYASGIKMAMPDIGAAFKGLTPAPSGHSGANTQLPPIIINLDGRQIAEVVEPHRFAMKRAGHALA